jgi:HEAT repeat protein
MALFGKQNQVASTLKKLEAGHSLRQDELDSVIESVKNDLGFQLDEHTWMFFHTHPRVRELARTQFRLWAPPSLSDRLIKEMAGKPAAARQDVARLLAESAPGRVQAQLGRMVHSDSPAEREAAVDLMTALDRCQELLPYLKVTLGDLNPPTRHRTARILVRGLDNPNVFLILRDLINDTDETLRRIIIEGFARNPTPEVVEPFFERLLEDVPEERALILSALSQLARTRQVDIEERILPMLGNEKLEIREISARLLSEMPDRLRVLRSFLVHCRGLAFWLRDRSLQSIHKVSDGLVEPLMKLMRDEEEDIRVGAMMLASGSRDPRLIPLIKEIFLGKSEWWIRSMAADVLGKFPDDEVTDLLLSRLVDPDLYYSIISILGGREGPASQRALLECLDHPKRGVRMAALNALQARKSPETLSAVLRVAEKDPDLSVRERAEDVLAALGDLGRSMAEKIARKRQETERAAVLASELQMVNEDLNRKPAPATTT